MEAVLKFLKLYVGHFGMFNLVLLALEEILGKNFVCPCRSDFNHWISFFYAFVPALGCFICTILFVDLSLQGEDEKEVKIIKCTKQRLFYSILAVSTCVSLFFLDGRYLACAYSNWDGVYVSDTLGTGKWCKPTGNEISELEGQKRTLELTFISQVTGLALMLVVILVLATFKYSNSQANTGASGQGNTEEEAPIRPTDHQTAH